MCAECTSPAQFGESRSGSVPENDRFDGPSSDNERFEGDKSNGGAGLNRSNGLGT